MHDKSRDHILREPLISRIEYQVSLGDGMDAEQVAEAVLNTLNDYGVIQYAPKGTLPLLSASGRVLVCIVANPDATLRELGMMLGVSESTVAKQVAQLVDANLITRTKVKGRNTYRLIAETAVLHADLKRFSETVQKAFGDDPGDSTN
jgi:DNA-binding MarR family transcriptional regulator